VFITGGKFKFCYCSQTDMYLYVALTDTYIVCVTVADCRCFPFDLQAPLVISSTSAYFIVTCACCSA
jgi:hypothetical protein